jgi:MFS family permease
MNRGFYTILAAQFFSSLADNTLLFVAIEILKSRSAPEWQTPVLQQFFVISFIVLAPFAGAYADSIPKGKAMFISNSIKICGCLALLSGLHPLIAYGFVGTGSALYSPAKYGILTEYLPPGRLIWANGWMEGLTVAAIILGAISGGVLVGDYFQSLTADLAGLHKNDANRLANSISIVIVLGYYTLAAFFNLAIPKLPVEHELISRTIYSLWTDFWASFFSLWRDPLGQVSLAVTSLFWGACTTLRFIILLWAAMALNVDMQEATQLTAFVAVGLAAGAFIASKLVPLEHTVKVLPLGIAMGFVIVLMTWVTDLWLAVMLLILIGVLAGCFLVPMNALLQHRGHRLMGSGHSIAVQNFNENSSMLLMLGAYALMLNHNFAINSIVAIFGLFVAAAMALITLKHGHDQDKGQT